MAEKKVDSRQTGSRDSTTDSVVELLTSILTKVQGQVQSNTPKALEGEALKAVELFREIDSALELHPRPTLDLTADPPQGGTVTLRWSSTNAETVSIEQEVGGVRTDLGQLT